MRPAAILDIGSSKIICLSGSYSNRDGIAVHGVAVCPYEGFEGGAFTDYRALHAAVLDAVRRAEQESRERIREIALSVPGPFCRLVLSEAVIPVTGKNGRVTAADIDEVISQSLSKVQAPGCVLMHSTPVSFTVNGTVSAGVPTGVRSPELGALVSHMYVTEEFVRTFEQILSVIDVEISMCVSQQLCCALAVIPEKERVRPAVLIDVGYRHTEVSVVENGALTAADSIGVGGWHFANDLSFGLDIPFESAELVKRRYVFLQAPLSNTQIVRTPNGVKRVDYGVIRLIMEARAGELSGLVRDALACLGITSDAAPVTYATGGGFVMVKGAYDYLKAALQLPVRRDTPWVQDMDTPNYTSAFAALDFVLRAVGDDVLDPSRSDTVADKLRGLFTR